MHLAEHQRVARECGIINTIKSSNGMILKIDENKTEKIGQISAKVSFVDGKRLLNTDDEVVKVRKKLEEIGMVFVNVIIDNKYKLLHSPVVLAPGGYDFEKDKSMYEIFLEDIASAYAKAIKQIKLARERDSRRFVTDAEREHFIEERIRNVVYKIYDEDIGKRPHMEVIFSRVQNQ
jgi:ribonuclease J